MIIASGASVAFNAIMPLPQSETTTFTIRNVDLALKARLRVRAARNGRSMEAELRSILRETLTAEASQDNNLAEAIHHRFSPFHGVDIEVHPPVPGGEPPSFE